MVQRGVKRKSGVREPNGRLVRVPTADVERHVMATVLRQRGGETSQLAENAVGRFVLRHRLVHELHDAAWMYQRQRNAWRVAKAVPGAVYLPGQGGEPPSPEAVAACRATVILCQRAMMKASQAGFVAIEDMLDQHQEITSGLVICDAMKALWALAQTLGLFRGPSPFEMRARRLDGPAPAPAAPIRAQAR